MHDYSVWCPVVTVCALFTDVRTYGHTYILTDGRQTKLDDISTAELKAFSCAKNQYLMRIRPFVSRDFHLSEDILHYVQHPSLTHKFHLYYSMNHNKKTRDPRVTKHSIEEMM